MRSRLDLSLFMSNAMYIAVFERQVNKCSPVATTSQPSTLRVAPRLSRAVTDTEETVCTDTGQLLVLQFTTSTVLYF